MKAALLISGYIRTFKDNLPNLKKQILDKFDNLDIYIHVTKNSNKDDKYLNIDNDINEINQILNPICLLYENNINLSDDKLINNSLNLWFKYHKLNNIRKSNELIKGEYDIIIKYRPDLNIISDNIFNQDITDNIVYIPFDSKIDKNKLVNKKDKYICDIFAYGNSKVMNQYFDIYEKMSYLIEKYKTHVSETLLYNYLAEFNIKYALLPIEYNVILSQCNVFAIAGDSGSGKTTLGNILKNYFSNSFMLECDRYHKWERKDDNWNKYTHLNPDANYLTKMNEDIFDLKIGKTIYQVDYDHSSGKFTEPEKIDSSDNIIVCGLHSLYNDEDSIYNLKIFIDTDLTLKYTWKIKRDIAKRGYSKEKILEQIENRKDDYIKFILPQKENSDVIINFFTDKPFNIDKLEDNLDIKLRISINKKFDIKHILNDFLDIGIKFKLNNNDNFNEIVFNVYQNKILDLKLNNNNYYDYILYFILNL
jgi:uridine kinase